ncbi:hypothetical protein HYU17_03885 [Candidatus Woesearchaeota archaeon]|nr:hypothetical protein [Candidatus Woesearchaeota archaeon]
MFGHIMDKWDSYLSLLLGVFVVVVAKAASLSPKLHLWFKYYVFIMIGVVIFDTVKNFGQHEGPFWKMAAIASNAAVLASCAIILGKMFNIAFAAPIVALPLVKPLLAMPNFMLYLGIFLIAENAMWIYVYDHF